MIYKPNQTQPKDLHTQPNSTQVQALNQGDFKHSPEPTIITSMMSHQKMTSYSRQLAMSQQSWLKVKSVVRGQSGLTLKTWHTGPLVYRLQCELTDTGTAVETAGL